MTADAIRLRLPAIAKGFQSITFMNNPAMLQRNAVPAIAKMPTLLLNFSNHHPKSVLPLFGGGAQPLPDQFGDHLLAISFAIFAPQSCIFRVRLHRRWSGGRISRSF